MKPFDILSRIIPISSFSRGGASKAFNMVEDDNPLFVVRNNNPIAVILTPADYVKLTEGDQAAE